MQVTQAYVIINTQSPSTPRTKTKQPKQIEKQSIHSNLKLKRQALPSTTPRTINHLYSKPNSPHPPRQNQQIYTSKVT